MGYPSLLYLTQPKYKPLSLTVFEDLQLLNFLPRSVAKAVRIPCEKENLLPRQRLFASLFRPEARECFAELYLVSAELKELNDLYASARFEVERYASFVALMDAERRFSTMAEGACFGDPLSDRFAAAFGAERKGARYGAMTKALDELLPVLDELTENSLRTHKETVRMGAGKGVTYLERIMACAETLGVGRPKVKSPEARRLSPDLLQAMANLRPEAVSRLKSFYEGFRELYAEAVTYYQRELQFYLVMLDFFDRIREADIPLTFPTVCEERGIRVTEAYDVSLLAKNETNIIPNDIAFSDEEPCFFLTGANGGGKTTYLRTVGIAAVLFVCGCPVPCRSAEMGELSSIFTHFPRDERFDGSGRFVEENRRVQKILEAMDDRSLVLLNETYSTTNEENAVLMTEKLATELHEKAILGLYITHQHALNDLGIPYLNVLIDRSDANRRTYKIARQKSTGGSYAIDILERCGLTVEALEKRFGPLSEEVEEA
ncbi:MAG: hypothetical protein IJD10_01150 [Clostridia bacterium]|nr:hypothetical protein [Clostridia bacterium]